MSKKDLIGMLVDRQVKKIITEAKSAVGLAYIMVVSINEIAEASPDADNLCLEGHCPESVRRTVDILDSIMSFNTGYIFIVDFSNCASVSATWWEHVWIQALEKSIEYGVYPMAAYLGSGPLAEMELVSRLRNKAFAICEVNNENHPINPQLVGPLEVTERELLKMLVQYPNTSARDIYQLSGRYVVQTSFNNRLARLHEDRLVYEVKHGRLKRFFPLMNWNMAEYGRTENMRYDFHITAPPKEPCE